MNMTLFNSEFAAKYPEVLETLSIKSEISYIHKKCNFKRGKNRYKRYGETLTYTVLKFIIFSCPTQHFYVNKLSELTEDIILKTIRKQEESRMWKRELFKAYIS